MRVTLIRHGETVGNERNTYSGATDDPLSERGRAAARAVAPDRTVKKVFVTPLSRTRETAAILFPEAEQVIVNDLREMDFGAFEGRSYAQMEHDADYRAWVESGCTAACPGGEDMQGFAARVGRAFFEVLAQNADAEALTFVVHGGTVMAVMTLFAGSDRSYWEWGVKNLGGWTAEAEVTEEGCRLKNAMCIRR